MSWRVFLRETVGKILFEPIVAFGKNSSVPHNQSGKTKLEKRDGQFVLLDFGVKFENYCSDMTRTVFFGEPSSEQVRIYKTVLEAQEKARGFINQSLEKGKAIRGSEVHKLASDSMVTKRFPGLPHGLGHGIGLEVHEHPSLSARSKDILRDGMVFSIEPGIYIPDFGGVRIEDIYTIKDKKLTQLTKSSKKLIVI